MSAHEGDKTNNGMLQCGKRYLKQNLIKKITKITNVPFKANLVDISVTVYHCCKSKGQDS